MANKKDFGAINTNRLYSAIETATSEKGQQITASQDEQAERASQLRTQGRKGCKLPRINMAFTTENHDFIKTLARVSGKTMTEFTNYVIKQYREEHPELYDKAKDIINSL